jgi:SAM-dependent methyltransferase
MAAFSFAFGEEEAVEPAEVAQSSAPPATDSLRAALELTAVDCDDGDSATATSASQPASWHTERIAVGRSEMGLLKRMPPEVDVPSLLRDELADVGDRVSDSSRMATSDLVPGVYEGGFKLWECSRDLLEVLHELDSSGELALKGTAVFEAGCGAGLPGALAARLGARCVVMQDYNASVLRSATMPTFRLNGLWPLVDARRVRFLSGDWACVSELLQAEASPAAAASFDVIVSADTIYSEAASRRLWQLVRELLRPGGTSLIAAKSYYFGVGGSVAAFKLLVAADPRFACRTVRTWEDGASNRREVFAITRVPDSAAGESVGRGDAAGASAGAPGDVESALKRQRTGGGGGSGFGGLTASEEEEGEGEEEGEEEEGVDEERWEASEIVPGLYLGGLASALDATALSEKGVGLVVSIHDCVSEQEAPDDPIGWVQFECHDRADADLLSLLPTAVEQLRAFLDGGAGAQDTGAVGLGGAGGAREGVAASRAASSRGARRVGRGALLVHCMQGVSRSSALVAAYLMSCRGMSLRDAMALIQRRRPGASPNRGFWRQLVAFERGLGHESSLNEEELPGAVLFEREALDGIIRKHLARVRAPDRDGS